MGTAWKVFALVVVTIVVVALAIDLLRRESSLLERVGLVLAVAAGVLKGGDAGPDALPLALLVLAAVAYVAGRASRQRQQALTSD